MRFLIKYYRNHLLEVSENDWICCDYFEKGRKQRDNCEGKSNGLWKKLWKMFTTNVKMLENRENCRKHEMKKRGLIQVFCDEQM